MFVLKKADNMKKAILLISLLVVGLRGYADEGMWLPQLLGQQVYDNMVKRGLKLSKEQLYSLNKSSLKDAVIIFGGGCTGEIVSPEGLIFTNHHCGYSAIASASSVEHNYLRDGFWAKSKADEIPTKLTVQFLVGITDVTAQVEDSLKGLNWTDRTNAQTRVFENIARQTTKGTDREARISAFFKANQFLMFTYERFRDVRFVGTPPESIGKFGGDTDNWEWPRHTGDFSVFRVYMSAAGRPADYSTANVPYKPKHYLPISIKPLKDGDYAMIYGYPGGTNRYETALGVKLKTDIENPTLVELRDARLKLMFEQMRKDPAVKLKLASSYASIANYWKFFDGETKQLNKFRTYDAKLADETRFAAWAKGKPEYENLFADWQRAYEAWRPYARHRVYMTEGVLGSSLAAFASQLSALEPLLTAESGRADAIKRTLTTLDEARTEFLKDEDRTSDQQILATTARMFYANVDSTQRPAPFYTDLSSRYGDVTSAATYEKWAADVFTNTMLFDDAKWRAFRENPSISTLRQDPAYAYVNAFLTNYRQNYAPKYLAFTSRNNELGRQYVKGIMAMNPAQAAKMYPDANFTMRVSFGNVKSYEPRDAVQYDYVCTMKGMMEKYKPGDYEFDLPANLIDLYRKGDFGRYKDPVRNDVVVSFITTNDITGGNSGSPVLNAKGELIGLAFDGNYEALSHKIAFDKDLNRTICVDVRYVLWCIEKLGGATNIINELTINK